MGPVKGGRPPFFFLENQGFAHFFGFICLIYWRTWSGEALWQDLRLCSWFDWLHSVTWLLEMPWKKGELGGILVWRMVRMSRLAKFYDKASVIKQSNFKQHGNTGNSKGIWFEKFTGQSTLLTSQPGLAILCSALFHWTANFWGRWVRDGRKGEVKPFIESVQPSMKRTSSCELS